MDNRPIGFFDSGLGGLTCIPYLMRELPEEKVVYFGDTARTPYGSKAVSTIRKFSVQIARFLVEQGVKMIVIACNTVSATVIGDIKNEFPDTPVIGIIEPAAKKTAGMCAPENRIGIIGTKATVSSGAYERFINDAKPGLNVFSTACPALVPLIEEGITSGGIIDLTIKYYLDDFINENRIDTVVLGCTHYPLIRGNLEEIYPDITIIDPSQEIVSKIQETLFERDMFAAGSEFENVFYASDLSDNFIKMTEWILK